MPRARHHRFPWAFGVLATAILLPILLATASPLLVALIPGALLTAVGIHALEGEEEDATKALPTQVVSPHDGAQAHRIYAAIEIPAKSRRV